MSCSSDPGQALSAGLAAHQRTTLPICGGMLGLTLAVPSTRVTALAPGSPAGAVGIAPGDVIVAINRSPVRTAQELIDLVQKNPPGTTVSLMGTRSGVGFEVPVTLKKYGSP